MVHAELEERVRDRQRPAPLRLPPPPRYGAEDRRPAWGGLVRHRTLPRPAAVIAALTLAATSVAPVRAQTTTEHYVLFPAGYQPASPKNEATFSGSASSTYQVKASLNVGDLLPLSDFLVDATFLAGNTRVRLSPQSVSPAAFAAVYTAGALGTDATLDAGIFEGDTPIGRLLTIRVRYDASARFTDAQSIGDLRWGTPQIEIYEGATVDPALAFAWSGYGTGTRNWATGDPVTAYTCRVGGDSVAFSTWPSSAGEDSTLFQVTPASTSTNSGTGRLNLTAAPDYENPTDSGGDNLYKVRVSSGHNLNAISGEGQRTGCNGSALELTVVVKNAGPPAPVRSLTGSLDSDTGILSVNWASPAGFLDGSDSSVVVPFDTARMSGSGAAGTAVAGYDVEYRLHGGSTWTQATTTTTSFEISGVGAGDAYTVRVRARNAEGTGAPATIDVPRPPEPPKPPEPPPNLRPRVTVSCDPCTVAPGGEVQLTARASDPDGDDLTYEWSTPEGVLGEETDAARARWTAPEATGRIRFRVRVFDGRGASASATVIVEVANEPPAFESSEYAFELGENIDGSRRPVALGEVAATDLDGDELTYELASGDRSRFEVGARDGALRYIGPGEDFESEAKRYELTVRVRDPYGGGGGSGRRRDHHQHERAAAGERRRGGHRRRPGGHGRRAGERQRPGWGWAAGGIAVGAGARGDRGHGWRGALHARRELPRRGPVHLRGRGRKRRDGGGGGRGDGAGGERLAGGGRRDPGPGARRGRRRGDGGADALLRGHRRGRAGVPRVVVGPVGGGGGGHRSGADAGAGGLRVGGGNGDGRGRGRPDGDADVRGRGERSVRTRGGAGHAGRHGPLAPGKRADDPGPAGDGRPRGRVPAHLAGARDTVGTGCGAGGG